MKFPCFKHSQQSKSLTGKVYKDKTPDVGDLPGAGDVADWIDWKGGKQELPDWMKKDTSAQLAKAKTAVDTSDKLRKVKEKVDKEREKVTYRPRLDIFGTIECQEWYLNKIRESLETLMMGDKLHDFIMAHAKYGVSDHLRWNDDFAKMIDLNVPKKYRGATKRIMQRRVAVAAQQVMADHFNSDLFKLVSENGWDKEDGKVGPYTTRVLREYWINVHQKFSKKQPQPPRTSDLGKGYGKNGINAKNFAAAVATLASIMATATPDVVEVKKETPAEKELKEKIEDQNKKAKEKYADLDKAGDKVKTADLKIEKHDFDMGMDLTRALGIAFGESPRPKLSEQSPKTYRVLNLLAQKKGEAVERMKIVSEDTLEITRDGRFIVYQKNGAKRYNIKLT